MSSKQKTHRRRLSPSTDERIRLGLIDVLGRIGDARAVDPLIALLDDQDQRTREVASEALNRIGEPAVESLLKIIIDPDRNLEHRCLSLGIISSIGARRKDVSDALQSLLQTEKSVPARLHRQSLYVAARLRDVKQAPYVVAALASDDWQTIGGAAKFLTEVPSLGALSDLQEALERWTSPEKNSFDRKYVQQWLLAAIVKAGQAESTEAIERTLEQSAQGNGPFVPEDAVKVMCEEGLAGGRAFLLKYLAEGLDQSRPRFLNRDIITFLAASWQPRHLDELNAAALDLEARDTDVAAKLVSTILRSRSGDDDSTNDRLSGEPVLYTLVKARATNFVPEASRLLREAGQWLSEHICEALWVANDSRAEEALLLKFDQSLADKNLDHLRQPLVRALGTCGTKRGAEAILAFLRSDEFEIFMPTETLPTLVRRQWLDQARLSDIAKDCQLNPHGRTECVLALGRLDAKGNKDLFRDLMFVEGEARLQGEDRLRRAAVIMLGTIEDPETVDDLRRLLRTTGNPSIAVEVAETLARRDVNEAIPDIRYALGKFGTSAMRASDFATALGRLGDTSHLPLVIEAFYQSRPIDYGITEDLGVFLPDRRAEQVILEQLETSRGMYHDAGEQKPAVRALARYAPNLLFKHVLRLHSAGQLDPTARLELATRMHYLSGVEGIEKEALTEVFKFLICDWYLPARERALQALGWAGAGVCNQVYEELRSTSDSWARACAVNTLAFCGEEEFIRSARFEESMFVRAAADVAHEMRGRRAALEPLNELYKSGDDLVRLSAYFSIKDVGDEITIWKLDEVLGKGTLARTFLGELADGVNGRIKKDREDRQRKVKKYVDSNGGVRFDSPPFAGSL